MKLVLLGFTLALGLLTGCSTLQAPASPGAQDNGSLSPVQQASVSATRVTTVALPNDLWERIRKGYKMPDLDSDLVSDRTQWYASKPDYLQRMGERSGRYLYYIVEEVERRNMPMELALLPFIESAFNPQAVSSARASGMWQFMPATGKSFDLKQNAFRDDRRDVQASTRAALDYLERLNKQFGDWHLALAAYNWGEGSVGRALGRNKAKGLPLDYSSLNMPNETRYYVPKLQAVKNIVAQPELFNVQLPLIQNHPFFKSVSIEHDLDVALAAQLAEVDLADFKALNPQMNRPVILAAGTPQILLPWDNAEIFERNLAARGNRPLATWTAWLAPRTMKPQEAAREVGMSEQELRSANGIPQGMLVKAGSALLVRRQGVLNQDVHERIAENGQLSLAPEIVLRRVMVTARKGDTLQTLAARYGVTANNVSVWNNLAVTTRLKTGQQLAVLVPSSPSLASRSRKSARTTGHAAATKTPAHRAPAHPTPARRSR